MLYQKLLTGQKPYLVLVRRFHKFPIHRHAELEIHYCMQGGYKIRIGNHTYLLRQGDVAIVGSMVLHEMPGVDTEEDTDGRGVSINVGPVLLKEAFDIFSGVLFSEPVYRADDPDERISGLARRVGRLCEEIAQDSISCEPAGELQILGNLYKVCGYFVEEILAEQSEIGRHSKEFKSVANIENALSLIYDNYYENITVEDAARLTGYKKSNFCKLFKQIVGDSFHQVLNRHRVEIAGYFLKETNISVEEIAETVGFADSKSFCRVFRSFEGMSPGQYRKQRKSYEEIERAE